MRAAAKAYDLVVYGATGFTGTLVAEYLARRARTAAGLRWAVAGRDAGKLEALASRLRVTAGGDIGVIAASGSEIGRVPQAAKAVITTAGPYALYGEPLLAACIEHSADYADLTGETPWAAMMTSKYEAEARRKGVTIVHMSGFDSIPADLGTFLLADTARARLGLGVHRVDAFMSGSGTVSGGTIASGLNIGKNPAMAAMVPDPLLLFPAAQVAAAGTGSATTLIKPTPDAAFPAYRPDFDSTTVPFVMAAINTRIVRRTAGLLAAHSAELAGHPHMLAPLPAGAAVRPSPYSLPTAGAGVGAADVAPAGGEAAAASSSLRSRAGAKTAGHPGDAAAPAAAAGGAGAGAGDGSAVTLAYSPHLPFAYSESMLVPVRGRVASYLAGLMTALIMAVVSAVLASPLLVRLVTPFVPKPGTGGSPAARARAWFHYDLIGATDDMKQSVTVRVSGGDGGYENTSEMLAEAGLLLSRERAALPCTAVGGGFLTPAVAFGRRLVEVLNEHTGMVLEVLAVGQPAPAARLRERGRPVKAITAGAAAAAGSK